MESVVTGVGANTPTGVDGVGSALPGSTSAGAATTLSETWRTAYDAWVTAAAAHVGALRRHADDWVETDLAQAARIERLVREGA
jgi:hypothetical protein